MSAAATPYCRACMLRLTGLRTQERAKRAHRMPVWRRHDAPLALLTPPSPSPSPSLLPDLSDLLSQSTAQGHTLSGPWALTADLVPPSIVPPETQF